METILLFLGPLFPLDPDSLRESAVSFWAQSQVRPGGGGEIGTSAGPPALCVLSVGAANNCGPNNKGLGRESMGRRTTCTGRVSFHQRTGVLLSDLKISRQALRGCSSA